MKAPRSCQSCALQSKKLRAPETGSCSPSGDGRPLTWVDVTGLYPDPKDCLAAFIVSSAAEVLAGVKPANLIRVLKRPLPCGRSVYALWQQHSADLLSQSSLSALTLREERDAILLLIYRADLLKQRLNGLTMKSFLKRSGYPQPVTLETALKRLRDDFTVKESPDEVGMFLGYPLKDVSGFISQRCEPWQGKCLWRIYGPPRRSLRLYQRYFSERMRLTDQIVAGESPLDLLKAA